MASKRRTKDELARDISCILTSSLHERTKRAAVKNAAWAWTTINGKYKGCRNWTKAAWKRWQSATPGKRRKGLHHEHAVPIEHIWKCLDSMPEKSFENVYDLFERLLSGVVVTKEEHAKLNKRFKCAMPNDSDPNSSDRFSRYKACGITVISKEWSQD